MTPDNLARARAWVAAQFQLDWPEWLATEAPLVRERILNNATSALAAAVRAKGEADAVLVATEATAANLPQDRWDAGYRVACTNAAAAIRECAADIPEAPS